VAVHSTRLYDKSKAGRRARLIRTDYCRGTRTGEERYVGRGRGGEAGRRASEMEAQQLAQPAICGCGTGCPHRRVSPRQSEGPRTYEGPQCCRPAGSRNCAASVGGEVCRTESAGDVTMCHDGAMCLQ
jgi:hypothetical protein